MSLKRTQTQVLKVDSPQPQLVKEIEELDKARNEIKDLEEKNISLEAEIDDLKKTIEMSVPEDKKLDALYRLKKDDTVKMLQEKCLVLEHKTQIQGDELLKMDERNKLLLNEKLTTMDRYQLDQEWQRLNSEVKAKSQELDRIQRGIDNLNIVKKEEIDDLNAIRAKYNSEIEQIKKIYSIKREVMTDYADFRKKAGTLPPAFTGELPKFEGDKKKGFLGIFGRKK